MWRAEIVENLRRRTRTETSKDDDVLLFDIHFEHSVNSEFHVNVM